jgi:general secretion pathway protein L
MNTLVVFLPPRPRLRASALPGPMADELSTEYSYVLSPDGIGVSTQGRAMPARMPKATSVVAVVGEGDLSWHRITLPKAPASRLRAALGGILEEALLEDADSIHLAVAPQASTGALTWVAAVDRTWLATELAVLEKANVFVDRVVPLAWPDEPASGHFAESADGDSDTENIRLSWAHADGVVQIGLNGSLARSLLPTPLPQGIRWSATPAVSLTAEQWLGQPVQVITPAHRALQAARSLWNLRQFSLARKNRGMRALRDAWRQFLSPTWRPVRFGLIGIVLLQIVGLNVLAWQQRSAVQAKQQSIVRLLQTTYPQVRAVLDAPVQMQRETDSLRAAAGRPGETDLEPMLQVAAAAWPADRPPVDDVRYEQPGKLTLAAAGWAPEQIDQFRNQLSPAGWQVEAQEGRLVLTRRAPGNALGRPL